VRGDFDTHLGHLPTAVGAWFVVDDHDVVAEEHADSYGEACLPGEFVCPGEGSGTQVERIQIDVAQAQYRRAELIPATAVFLHHHAMCGEGADDPVHRGRRQPEFGCQLGQCHPSRAL
jgi:hypothetical protein